MTEHTPGADLQRLIATLESELAGIIVGQQSVVRGVLTALLAGGHVLLEGVPGLGKTLLVRTLAECVDLSYSRIQFTPDLMPADIIGTDVITDSDSGRQFAFQPGPIFAHLILADEINRATPRTQSAMLEAMQEHAVTVGRRTHPLPEPFFVLATQNPIDLQGTYPLPEAQSDRFMLKIRVTYPDRGEEKEILRRAGLSELPPLKPQAGRADVLEARAALGAVYVADKLQEYVLDLVTATRRPRDYGLALETLIAFGASPRATLFLTRGAQAVALLAGRAYALPEDVKAIALDVLRHRIHVSYEAEAEGVDGEEVARRILEQVRVP